jgi:hypothetical protein
MLTIRVLCCFITVSFLFAILFLSGMLQATLVISSSKYGSSLTVVPIFAQSEGNSVVNDNTEGPQESSENTEEEPEEIVEEEPDIESEPIDDGLVSQQLEEVCNNGVDDDGNGLVDSEDGGKCQSDKAETSQEGQLKTEDLPGGDIIVPPTASIECDPVVDPNCTNAGLSDASKPVTAITSDTEQMQAGCDPIVDLDCSGVDGSLSTLGEIPSSTTPLPTPIGSNPDVKANVVAEPKCPDVISGGEANPKCEETGGGGGDCKIGMACYDKKFPEHNICEEKPFVCSSLPIGGPKPGQQCNPDNPTCKKDPNIPKIPLPKPIGLPFSTIVKCQKDPSLPECQEKGVKCKLNPSLPECQPPICEAAPGSQSCIQEKCKKDPNLPICPKVPPVIVKLPPVVVPDCKANPKPAGCTASPPIPPTPPPTNPPTPAKCPNGSIKPVGGKCTSTNGGGSSGGSGPKSTSKKEGPGGVPHSNTKNLKTLGQSMNNNPKSFFEAASEKGRDIGETMVYIGTLDQEFDVNSPPEFILPSPFYGK